MMNQWIKKAMMFVLTLSCIVPYNAIYVNASSSSSISDFKWNDSGTSRAEDDYFTFTAPEEYRDLDSTSYKYYFHDDYDNSDVRLSSFELVMDANGRCRINFKNCGIYGRGFLYKCHMQIEDEKTYKVLFSSNTVTHEFPVTDLRAPANIHTQTDEEKSAVLFEADFGTERNRVEIYNSDETKKLFSKDNNSGYLPISQTYLSTGNVIKVTSYNDTVNKVSKTSSYRIVEISDLTWHALGTKDPSDDTLTFTAPIGYRNLTDTNDYRYVLCFLDAQNNDQGGLGFNPKSTTIDANGLVTLKIVDNLLYASASSPRYRISLSQTNMSNNGFTPIVYSNIVDVTLPADMEIVAPENIFLYSNLCSWKAVLGASSYTVRVKDSSGNVLKTYTTDKTYQMIDAQYLVNGNILDVMAKDDTSHVSLPKAMTIDSTQIQKFVKMLYSTTLDRDPDADGLNYWSNQLLQGKQTGMQVVKYFCFGPEFVAKNYCNEHFLIHLYKAIFSRNPDAEGLAYWEGQMSKGMSREAVLNGFLGGDEFDALCSKTGIRAGKLPSLPAYGTIQTWPCSEDNKMDNGIGNFVLRMYTKCLGREAEQDGANWWITQLNLKKISGNYVAKQFFLGEEFKAQNYSDSEYLNRLYRTIFGREADAEGKAYWMGQLRKGVSRESVLNGFTGGDEWTDICIQYGIKK